LVSAGRALLLLGMLSTCLEVAQGQESRPAGPAHAYFEQEAARLEAEIATLLQRRGEARPADAPAADAQIDIRIVERWLALRAADAPADDPIQPAAYLRMVNLQAIAPQLEKRLASPKSTTQLDGLRRLHQMTYKLPELKNLAAMDEACKTMGTHLILAGGPTQQDTRNLPPMRPSAAAGPESRETVPKRNVPELIAHARSLRVSPALHRELTALASDLTIATTNPARRGESSGSEHVLRLVVELLDGVEQLSAVGGPSRPQLEEQITASLALYNDERTRPAGKKRLLALEDYQPALERLRSLKLSLEFQQKLAPALTWIRENPAKGAKVEASIEEFVQLCATQDGHEGDASGAPQNQRKILETMRKQFATQREAFLSKAAALDGANAADVALRGMNGPLDQMRQIRETMDGIELLPKAIAILAAYKPKPYGILDRRAAMAMGDLGSAVSTDRHEAAIRCILDANRLARLAKAADQTPAGVPPEIVERFAGGKLNAVEQRRVTLIGELASDVGLGKPMDRVGLAELEALPAMLDALRDGAATTSAMAQTSALIGWVDWAITPEQLGGAIAAYRESTSAAFEGFAENRLTAINRWTAVHEKYEPFLRLIRQAASNAEACSKLPTGYFAECAKLMTPMDEPHFAGERRASLALSVWSQTQDASGAAAANVVLDEFLTQLSANR
jgi:hypothetical protein